MATTQADRVPEERVSELWKIYGLTLFGMHFCPCCGGTLETNHSWGCGAFIFHCIKCGFSPPPTTSEDDLYRIFHDGFQKKLEETDEIIAGGLSILDDPDYHLTNKEFIRRIVDAYKTFRHDLEDLIKIYADRESYPR